MGDDRDDGTGPPLTEEVADRQQTVTGWFAAMFLAVAFAHALLAGHFDDEIGTWLLLTLALLATGRCCYLAGWRDGRRP